MRAPYLKIKLKNEIENNLAILWDKSPFASSRILLFIKNSKRKNPKRVVIPFSSDLFLSYIKFLITISFYYLKIFKYIIRN